jgi:tetratricopeptide repeat protein/cytochrome c554/c'-like protein
LKLRPPAFHFPQMADARKFASVVFLLFLAAIVMPVAPPQPPAATSARDADALCARCHQRIYDSYMKTVMANASGPAVEHATPATFRHKPSAVEYRVSVENGKVWLNYDRPGEFEIGGLHGRRLLEYYIGSGNRGRTYLYSFDGYWFEVPINWYTAYGGYDMRPGFQNSIMAPFDLPVASRCLHCHTSDVQLEMPGTRNRFSSLPFLHTGITCEACHGDSSRHVATSGKEKILNPAKLDPPRRDSVCQQCHLEGEILIDRAGKKLAQFRPGELLTDYAAYFVHAGAPKAGFGPVTQVEALPLSKCKQASGDKLSCITCHDPHRKVAAEEKVAYFREKCLQCHSAPKFAADHHSENPDCASCHMPRNKAVDIPHQQTTDHRIPRIPPPASAPAPPGKELVSVLTSQADDRDLGLAYAKLAESGDEFAAAHGLQLLQSAQAKSPQDSALLAGLAFLLKKQGKDAEAIRIFRKALESDPQNSWAAANLGVLYKKIGEPDRALALWEEVFSRTPFYAGLNLSALDCSLGRRSQALAVLNRMLEFDPDSIEIRRRLSEVQNCSNKSAK